MLGQVITTHHVEYQVHAHTVGFVFNDLCKVFGLVEDGAIGSQLSADSGFVLGSNGGKNSAGACPFGKANGCGANAAGAAMNEHRLSRAQLPTLDQIGPDGQKRLRQTGGRPKV